MHTRGQGTQPSGGLSHAEAGRDARRCHPGGDGARRRRYRDGFSAQPHGIGQGPANGARTHVTTGCAAPGGMAGRICRSSEPISAKSARTDPSRHDRSGPCDLPVNVSPVQLDPSSVTGWRQGSGPLQTEETDGWRQGCLQAASSLPLARIQFPASPVDIPEPRLLGHSLASRVLVRGSPGFNSRRMRICPKTLARLDVNRRGVSHKLFRIGPTVAR